MTDTHTKSYPVLAETASGKLLAFVPGKGYGFRHELDIVEASCENFKNQRVCPPVQLASGDNVVRVELSQFGNDVPVTGVLVLNQHALQAMHDLLPVKTDWFTHVALQFTETSVLIAAAKLCSVDDWVPAAHLFAGHN